jgi:hypothetical protein
LVTAVLFFGFVSLLPQNSGWWITAWQREHMLHSESGLFNRLSVVSVVKEHNGARGDLAVTLDVHDTEFHCSPLQITLGHEPVWEYRGSDGKLVKETRTPSTQDVQRWLEDGGLACDSPGKLAEVAELAGLVDDIRRDPASTDVALLHLRSIAMHQTAWNEPTKLQRAAAIAAPATLWLIGIVIIRRSTRKRARRADQRVSGTSVVSS